MNESPSSRLQSLLDEVEYILSLEYNKSRGLILSEDAVELLREKYLELMDVWQTVETVLKTSEE